MFRDKYKNELESKNLSVSFHRGLYTVSDPIEFDRGGHMKSNVKTMNQQKRLPLIRLSIMVGKRTGVSIDREGWK